MNSDDETFLERTDMATLCWHCRLYVFFGPVSEAFQLISSSSLHLFPPFFEREATFHSGEYLRRCRGYRLANVCERRLEITFWNELSLSLVNTRSLLIIRIFFSSSFLTFLASYRSDNVVYCWPRLSSAVLKCSSSLWNSSNFRRNRTRTL